MNRKDFGDLTTIARGAVDSSMVAPPAVSHEEYAVLAAAFLDLSDATGKLLEKMDAVDEAGLDGVFQMAAIHGAPWTGPNWGAERARLDYLLGRKAGV